MGFGELIERHLVAGRGKNTQLRLADPPRQSLYGRVAGYAEVNEAERLSRDPAFRLIGSSKIGERGAALTSRLRWFETEVLRRPQNLAGLAALNRELIARAQAIDPRRRVALDMDRAEVRVCGAPERSARNGHFESACHHPPPLFNDQGDRLAVKPRPGDVAGAAGWEESLAPAIDRLQARGIEVAFRAAAAFARPGIHESVEVRAARHAIRLPATGELERGITESLKRPAARPGHQPGVRYKSFFHQAASWTRARRVAAKVEFHLGEVFPPVGFSVTRLTASNRAAARRHHQRGAAEQWIKEGQQAAALTRLSRHRFRATEARRWLSVIAYNPGNLRRRLALPKAIGNWALTSLQQRLVKTGGRLVQHARYRWPLLAERHLTRRLFAGMPRQIAAPPAPAG